MMRNRGQYIRHGIAFTVAVAFASTLTVATVRADDRHRSSDGAVLGGIIGAVIGSTVGRGSERVAAIGAGALLGSFYGHLVDRGGYVREHRRTVRRHHRWQGNRRHYGGWHAPRHRRHRYGQYHRWTPPHVHSPAVSRSRSKGFRVEPRTARRTPHYDAADKYLGSGSVAVRPGRYRAKCRVLEDGLSKVYVCRDTVQNWRSLR
jgi:hypothetical protein